jgi:SNF2 family DNA or RNA helicase
MWDKSSSVTELKEVEKRGGVLLTSFGKVSTKAAKLRAIEWSVVMIDEGHKIKNHRTAIAKDLRTLPSQSRILLTGTPIQNNLNDLWSLFDYVCKGTLLGDLRVFNTEFGTPIAKAAMKYASPQQKNLAATLSRKLIALIKPHFLQRLKKEVFPNGGFRPGAQTSTTSSSTSSTLTTSLAEDSADAMGKAITMHDFVVW